MQGFISIVAASAVLSAGLVAGLSAGPSAADATPSSTAPAKVLTDRLPVEAPAPSGWIDPPARTAKTAKPVVGTTATSGTDCAPAWPHRSAGCAAEAPTPAPVRKVRVIAVEGQPSAPSTALALR